MFIIAQTRIEYLGLIISQGKIELQPHVLNSLSNFADYLPDVKTVQIFLGCLNYIKQFYLEQATDTKLLQQRLKKGSSWNDQMSKAVRNIKQKIEQLPPLALPHSDLPFILETYALDYFWATILLQKHGKKEEVCAYAFGTFSEAEKNYPSSQKEILAVKKGIKRFRLFLKSVHFVIKTDLRHMKGMLQNKRLLEQGNSKVLRWALWLDGYDFDIIYKAGKENYLADLMTKEGAIIQIEYAVKNFEFGECSSSSQNKSQVTLCSSCHYSFCVDCIL